MFGTRQGFRIRPHHFCSFLTPPPPRRYLPRKDPLGALILPNTQTWGGGVRFGGRRCGGGQGSPPAQSCPGVTSRSVMSWGHLPLSHVLHTRSDALGLRGLHSRRTPEASPPPLERLRGQVRAQRGGPDLLHNCPGGGGAGLRLTTPPPPQEGGQPPPPRPPGTCHRRLPVQPHLKDAHPPKMRIRGQSLLPPTPPPPPLDLSP